MSIPTAEEFLKSKGLFNDKSIRLSNIGMTTSEAMIEFAKMHVTAALKEASDKAIWKHESFDTHFGDSTNFDFIDTDCAGDPSTGHNVFVDKDSILNSYPLDKIR